MKSFLSLLLLLISATVISADGSGSGSGSASNSYSNSISIDEKVEDHLDEHEYDSLGQLQGSMSQENCPDPVAFERGNYVRILGSYRVPDSVWR